MKVVIAFGFKSDWYRGWQEFFEPITERRKVMKVMIAFGFKSDWHRGWQEFFLINHRAQKSNESNDCFWF